MKPILFRSLSIIILFLISFSSYSQVTFQKVNLFNQNQIDLKQLEKLPAHLHLDLNSEGFNFQEVQITSPNFQVTDSKNRPRKVGLGRFYQDKSRNASMSVFGKDMVLIYDNFEVTNKGKKNFQIRPVTNFPFSCYTDDDSPRNNPLDLNSVGNLPVCRAVQIYFEADYKLYQDKGSSVTNVTNYVTALFNQIALLYSNEQIPVQISQLKVWNTPDPYIQFTSISSVLNKFKNDLNGVFNGNLAHLLSTRSLGGGIAYVDVLCFKPYAVGVSGITTSFQNVPTYSWSVEVVTHELGHNLGSWHTQSCNWPGGAIDNCYYPEGSCSPGPPPVNGGTIMSYCHLTQYGINFNNGFGPLPGNLIRSKFNNAACLTGTSLPPSGLTASNITQTTAKLQWNVISGAVYELQWKKTTDSQWNVISGLTLNSYNLAGLSASTQYDWKVKTDCSVFSSSVSFVTLPNSNVCWEVQGITLSEISQTSCKVSWNQVIGATSYNIQYKEINAVNWIEIGVIPTLNYTIGNLVAATTYLVKVSSNCNPTFSVPIQFTTLSNGGGGCPVPTNLQTLNITATSATLSWSPVAGATGYKIALKFPNSTHFTTIGSTFLSTSVNFYGFDPGSTYEWKVKTLCSDWSAAVSFTTLANLIRPKLILFPNPSHDEIFVNLDGDFQIVDLTGQVRLKGNSVNGLINVSELIPGMYILNIDNQFVKFIKE